MEEQDTPVFEDLIGSELIPVDLTPHPSGMALHQPSTRYETKYECIRCGKVRGGPKMTAVHYGVRLGICQYCASQEEKATAIRFPSALVMRPLPAPKETPGRKYTNRLMDSAVTRRTTREIEGADAVPQPKCPVCGKEAIGGLVCGIMDTTKRKCGLCREVEDKSIRSALKL